MERVVYWFRRDLRIRDNWGLERASQTGAVVGVFVWDSAVVGRSGRFARAFLLDSLVRLREEMRRLGSDLVVVRGIEELVGRRVVCSDEVGVYESAEADRVGAELVRQDYLVDYVWGELPGIFTKFREEVEPVDCVLVIGEPTLRGWDWDGGACVLDELAVEFRDVTRRFSESGEVRLREFVWGGDGLRRYKETRNGFSGEGDSSCLSAYLAWGCLSPRQVFCEVRRFEMEVVANDSTYWLIFELLWRDYFHYLGRQQSAKIFLRGGIQDLELEWDNDRELFSAWCEGRTGYPIVDASMRQLAETGWMSNRGRQITANFLTKVLNLDWRWGAEWFEHQLIDYDVASNWGNWQYQAGVGTNGREFRVFHPVKQAIQYDPNSKFIQQWLPESEGLGAKEARTPGVHLPVVADFDQEVEQNRIRYLRAVRSQRSS